MSANGPKLSTKDKEMFDKLQVLSHQADIESLAKNAKELQKRLRTCLLYFKNQGHNVNYLGEHQGYSVTMKLPEARERLMVFAKMTGDTTTIFPNVLPTSKTKDANLNKQEEAAQSRKLTCSA